MFENCAEKSNFSVQTFCSQLLIFQIGSSWLVFMIISQCCVSFVRPHMSGCLMCWTNQRVPRKTLRANGTSPRFSPFPNFSSLCHKVYALEPRHWSVDNKWKPLHQKNWGASFFVVKEQKAWCISKMFWDHFLHLFRPWFLLGQVVERSIFAT